MRVFDTNLAKPLRTLIRERLIAQLSPLLKRNGGYLAELKPFGAVITGSGDDVHIDMLWDLLQGKAPAVAIALGDKQYTAAGDQWRYKGPLDIHVYVVLQHNRSPEARLAGDVVSEHNLSADPGGDVILEEIEQLLIGADLGIGPTVKELRPERERFVTAIEHYALFEQAYTCVVTRTINPARRARTQQLDEIKTTGHLAPDADPTRRPITTTITENI